MASHNYNVVRTIRISPEKTKEYVTRFGSDERIAKEFFAMECDYGDMDEIRLLMDGVEMDKWTKGVADE